MSAELDRYERRFRRAALPPFIEDFSPTHDIYTRATPPLIRQLETEPANSVTSLVVRQWMQVLVVSAGVGLPPWSRSLWSCAAACHEVAVGKKLHAA
ncbi:hypothetical protein AB0E69_04815 [Kribbella sp. NPDC026611]|uniref:hypothetical protein n=1 Tax=Kribbella sp. NPDC026611 TaxID=3154911 RepID=UPI0033EBB1F9